MLPNYFQAKFGIVFAKRKQPEIIGAHVEDFHVQACKNCSIRACANSRNATPDRRTKLLHSTQTVLRIKS